jgi:HlyD family secretion protein
MRFPSAMCLSLLLAAPSAYAQTQTLRLEGELFARESAPLSPPSIDNMWNLNISRIAPDGAPVKRGEPVLAFEGGQLQKQLMEKMSALAEKQSQRDKLLLELAERERNERLASAEALANRDKAQRKATQPENLVRRVDYQKLVAERSHAERALELAQRREILAAEQRRQERRLIDADVQQLQTEVNTLQASIGSLQVLAPRDGIVIHRSDGQGNKFDVGTQVWRGQVIAEVPDLSTLAVRATMPEHQFTQLATGMPARVVVEGSGLTLAGRVTEIGQVVRSKSRLQPVPVLDVLVLLDAVPDKLKPGQAVRVEIAVDAVPGVAGVAP